MILTTEIDSKIVEQIRPLFGEFAQAAFEQQKQMVGVQGTYGPGDYQRLAEGIRTMCSQIAGAAVAEKVYRELVTILTEKA